jgi:hypothetical protein
MVFRGKVRSICLWDWGDEWCIDVALSDSAAAASLCKDIGCEPTARLLLAVAPGIKNAWLRWIIHQLAPHLGRDQELRARIEFDL